MTRLNHQQQTPNAPRGLGFQVTRALAAVALFGALLPQARATGWADRSLDRPALSRVGQVEEKIVGGGVASAGSQRWITSLQYDGQHFCGGALVAPEWVLTAAHCVITESAAGSAFSVWVGGHDLRYENQGVRRDVAEIRIHPGYDDGTLVNDIALLRLDAPVTGAIEPVRLADAAVMAGPAAPNQPVQVSGWGALSESGGSPDALHEVTVPIVSNATCNAPASYAGEIGPSQLCAGLRDGGKDACYGDSGGPMWVSVDGIAAHVGIVSWGEGCARPDFYGVYTRTASYGNWVAPIVGGPVDEGPDDPDPLPDDPDDDGGSNGDGGGGGGQCDASDPDQDAIDLLDPGEIRMVSAIRDASRHFAIDVPAGSRRLIIDTWGGIGDADLYVAQGRQPTTQDYDFSPYLDGNDERVSIASPAAGRWFITVHGYQAFKGVNLRAIIRD